MEYSDGETQLERENGCGAYCLCAGRIVRGAAAQAPDVCGREVNT